MKHLLIITSLVFTSLFTFAQNAKQTANGNYIALTSSKSSTPAKNTGKTYTDSKGIVYPVMITGNGKLFVIRTSKKTGKEYKQYLKLQ